MAQQVQDEGFHEIQLNGKQLVFLFMAATVVSVVIFLCGVLVGRGVKAQVATGVDAAPATTLAETTPTQPQTPPPAPAAGSDPTTAPPPPPASEDLSYFKRLEQANAPAEQLKPTDARSTSAPQRSSGPAAVAPPTPAPPAPPKEKPARPGPEKETTAAKAAAVPPVAQASAAAAEPSGQGFAVQIAALNVRSDADAIAKRLSAKGYSAYVLTPASGSPSVFRVRVGKFNTRHEAETVAAKLQKEEQFKPWVTR